MTDDPPRADHQRPGVFGLLAVCALVFGGALLVVVQRAGAVGSRTPLVVVGLVGIGLALVFAVAAAVEHSRR